jgi:hypothetical protein
MARMFQNTIARRNMLTCIFLKNSGIFFWTWLDQKCTPHPSWVVWTLARDGDSIPPKIMTENVTWALTSGSAWDLPAISGRQWRSTEHLWHHQSVLFSFSHRIHLSSGILFQENELGLEKWNEVKDNFGADLEECVMHGQPVLTKNNWANEPKWRILLVMVCNNNERASC